MKKILTVSLFAIMAVGAANADIASTTYVDNKVSTAKTEIDGTVATLATKETVNGINTRVTTAEGKISTAEGKITTLEGKVSAMEGGNLAIGDGAVDTDQLANESVTEAKLATELANKIDAAQTATQVDTAINTKITELDLANTYDAKGAAAAAESAAKAHADGLNTAMNTRVETAEGKISALEGLAGTYQTKANLSTEIPKIEANQSDDKYTSETAVVKYVEGQLQVINNGFTERDTAIGAAQTAAEAAQAAANENADAIEVIQGSGYANSGITSAKVGTYDTHVANGEIHVTAAQKTEWSGKQAALSEAQLSAVNSGITSAKVNTYDTHVANANIHVTADQKAAWDAKQAALSETQLNAVNSGATEAKINQIATNTTAISNKQGKSTVLSLGTTNGGWLDLTKIDGYSATGMYSLVMDGGNIKWEKVDTGTN